MFTYSHEEGTTAFDLTDDVPAAIKKRRQSRLMARQKRIVAKRQQARVGERARLLVDGPSPEHELVLRGRLAGPGARHRPAGLPDRLRPDAVSGRRLHRRRDRRRARLRPDRPAALGRSARLAGGRSLDGSASEPASRLRRRRGSFPSAAEAAASRERGSRPSPRAAEGGPGRERARRRVLK